MQHQRPSNIVCRGYAELRLPDRLTLEECAERGRILSDDYLFDTADANWVRARELAQLQSFYRRRSGRRALRVSGLCTGAAAIACFVTPALGLLLSVAAIVSALIARQRLGPMSR